MGQWKMVREMIDVYSSCQVLFCTDLVKCLWVNGRCYGSYWLCTIYGRWEMQFCILAKSLLKKDCYWVTCCDLIGVGIYIYISCVVQPDRFAACILSCLSVALCGSSCVYSSYLLCCCCVAGLSPAVSVFFAVGYTLLLV